MLIEVGHSHRKKTIWKDPGKWEMSPKHQLLSLSHHTMLEGQQWQRLFLQRSHELSHPDWGSHLRPSCLQTTLASQSVQWSAQMVPQSPLKYSSTVLSSANRTAPSKRKQRKTTKLLSSDGGFRPACLRLAHSWAELHLGSLILFCWCCHWSDLHERVAPSWVQ